MIETAVRLYIELDALMDTRAGVLTIMDPGKTAKLMHDKSYAQRVIDAFPDFGEEEYKKRYKERDAIVLKNSMITPAVDIVKDFSSRVCSRRLGTPLLVKPEIHVNTYPYVLTDQEKYAIGLGMVAKMPVVPKVVFIHKKPEELTPGFVKARYNTMVMYDFCEWIEMHSVTEAIKETPIPEVTVFTPALVKKIDEKFPKDPRQVFVDLMSIFQMHVNAIFLPAGVFSSVLAKRDPVSPEADRDSHIPPLGEDEDLY